MKPILLITSLLLALCSAQLRADHITVEGSVSGEWNADTVMVTGDITVPNGQTLLIRPGTVVEFTGSYKFTIDGAVDAQGMPGENIIFESADTTGFSVDSIPDGGWQGIRFDHVRLTNDPSVFTYCNFSFGKVVSADPATGHGGAIYIKAYNNVTIDECTFHNNFATYNGGAVYLDSADIIIHGSTFTGNRCGLAVAPWGYGGAICSDNSNPEIRWNVFEDNYSTGVGGALAVRYEDCNVYNNIFKNNASALGGAFGFLYIPTVVYRVNNNLIVNNSATYFGGGVANLVASPVYINNTIAYNQAMYGGGFYCKDSVSPDFYNTIIWGNNAGVGSQGYLFEVYSQADFFNCDVQGGPGMFGGSGGGEAFFGAFEQCLDTVPEFIGSGDYPYALSDNSPLIDMGSSDTSGFFLPETDLAGNPRWYGALPDMGAYEWAWVGMMDGPVAISPVKVWPNPCSDGVNILINSDGEKVEMIEVYDATGRIIETDIQYVTGGKSKYYRVKFNVNTSISELLILKITLRDRIISKKLIKSFTQSNTE
jgi:predicted outer membrane repeat protein